VLQQARRSAAAPSADRRPRPVFAHSSRARLRPRAIVIVTRKYITVPI